MQSLNIFMHELLDYAGLFPPAKLTLQESLLNYSSYTKHIQKNWLGKFILPSNKIAECIEIMLNQKIFKSNNASLKFSIILNSCEKINDYSGIIDSDLKLIDQFESACKNKISIDSIEFFPPKEVFQPNNLSLFKNMLSLVDNKLCNAKKIKYKYLEIPFSENINEYIEFISDFNLNQKEIKFCIKLRTGGVTPQQIPSAFHIAQAIRLSAEKQIPIKATAGLHVPVPNDNPEVGARLHGFFNIFSCLLLCYKKLLTISEMENILENYSYSDFKFTEDGFTVGNKFLANAEMTHLRNSFIKSFGTCSFLEPIEHLHENNFLEGKKYA
ncbi:hypothetical protein QEJ31_05480 [Pigmentibacter sp. JX0631]|uniref:hypothetical protein n=1 Tax=Pigmentibacter sp. JX0631 TaxID=2976982 RepID=UPI002469A064|nr:hypothetical protein [Pigmentibacter sp. JX0631]WGL61045.1 hypothetical protein QEJ31_05480 [Pigmentibacter sp. JX0631]